MPPVVKNLIVTRWYVKKGKKKIRVPAGTLGATKVTEETNYLYVVDRSGGKVVRVNTGCTDKRAAQAFLAKYLTAIERGEQGLTDPHKPHLDRLILEHLAEYLATVREISRYALYPRTIERELTRLFKNAGFVLLRDMTTDRVQQYLTGLVGVKAGTKNKIRTYLVSFGKWLVEGDRIVRNPIERVKRAVAKPEEKEKRHRRAMTRKQLRDLLSAAERFPLVSGQTPKGGKPRKDGSKAQFKNPVKLSDETIAKLTQEGRERRLVYRTALLTGLRRGELSRLRVGHFKLKRRIFDIPAQLTKNGRPAKLPLVPALVADLRQWIADTHRKPDDPLFHVPDSRSMARQHEKRLKLADIPYKTEHGFADFHSLRKSINTRLRRKGVSLRLRQRFLRHAAADLATTAYDDERLAELRPVVEILTRLDAYLNNTKKPIISPQSADVQGQNR